MERIMELWGSYPLMPVVISMLIITLMACIVKIITILGFMISSDLVNYKWFRRLRGGTWINDQSSPYPGATFTLGWHRVKKEKKSAPEPTIEEY